MASRFRSWTWTRIDGRNVLAMPTRDEVHLYDSEDFILLDKIAPTGHRSYIHAVRWSAFHGKLASLSHTQLIVHAPQLTTTHSESGAREATSERVRFVRICDFDLTGALADLRGIAFSRCADLLLFGGPTTIGMLDIRATAQLRNAEDLRLSSLGDADKKLVWTHFVGVGGVDVVKFSPSSFVVAGFLKGASVVHVWRTVRDATAAHDLGRRVIQVHALEHPEPVAYASWKPASTQMHAAVEYDGARKARWFEPQRMLLTCTRLSRTVRVWIESENTSFVPALVFEPTLPLRNVRWVLSKNRNISEEKFQIVDTTDEQQVDWMSGVDDSGVLHLYQLLGVASKSPRVRDTELRIKVNGEEESKDIQRDSVDCEESITKLITLEEICVMAYFSQNYFGLPSKFDIVLQRSDGIILSYIIAIGRGKKVQVKKKSWYRNHLGSIAALAAHPSLPLIASVDEHRSDHTDINSALRNEILIFWVSFSAFSAESRLIPSGVLECPRENGPVLCVQWIPTLHFDATPLFLVAYASGAIDIYGRSANARDVVNSPRTNKRSRSPRSGKFRHRSPSLSPWTFFDYATGQSAIEYEVAVQKDNQGLGFGFKLEDGVLRVSEVIHSDHPQLSRGDEIVALNSELLMDNDLNDFQRMLDALPLGSIALLRFRAQVEEGVELTIRSPTSTAPALHEEHNHSGDVDRSGEEESPGHIVSSSAQSDISLNASYVHAGSVSMYGGWRQLLSAKVASNLHLVCVCPVYADDGEYIAGTVLIFGVCGSLPGSLSVWKGQYSTSGGHTYSIHPLHINDGAVSVKGDITSIAGERDYRQRAFTSSKRNERATQSLNSLVFIGDASGSVHHWRCRITENTISFAMMSKCSPENLRDAPPVSGSVDFNLGSFFRRGYYNSRRGSGNHSGEEVKVVGIHHIEVDDPNRIAVLHASQPDALHIFEGESGLGIMRLEETIYAEGRGRILGFCWCNAHVEFNIDALAVQYESAIVIYQYDMNTHRWVQVGKDVRTNLAIFDCTRDSSALLIGGGHIGRVSFQEETEEIPVVLGKWDEPGNLLQDAMDWKAPESPQKLPVWHPYVIVTTLFGMHARVGVKDTTMASDTPVFEFSKAFKDAVQMLKLLAKVLEDDASTRLSAGSGVLAYSIPQNSRVGKSLSLKAAATAIMFIGQGGSRHDSIGRYSTAIHTNASLNKAENLFADPVFRHRDTNGRGTMGVSNLFGSRPSTDKLGAEETGILSRAIEEVLQSQNKSKKSSNASIMFGSFQYEHLLEFKAVLHFVDAVQSLSFELDASAADLGAKRYYAMFLFGKSLHTILSGHSAVANSVLPDQGTSEGVERSAMDAYAKEAPSSGLLWALHSNAQAFLIEHCVVPQPTWEELRPMWIALWVRDIKDLRAIAERLAKTTYMKTRDAMGVVLFYVALGKKNILGALAKMSKIETNKNLAIFLENDFNQERWTNAAVKNAYSLLSKKQYEAAAGFFLLCEPPRLQEALRLLAVRLEDPSLALLVARLVEHRTSDSFSFDFISAASSGGQKEITPIGSVTRRLLEHDLIPLFRERRDRWLESAALWWLEDFEQACTILMPQSQPIDMDLDKPKHNRDTFVPEIIASNNPQLDVIHRSRSMTYFFVNLTSIPLYFQFLHASGIDAPLVTWAIKKLLTERDSFSSGPSSTGIAAVVGIAARRHKLASTADIEHAFSFAAYVCKRSGMSDTSVVEMLQARHLVNLHAKQELRQQSSSGGRSEETASSAQSLQGDNQLSLPTSPRMASILRDWRKSQSPRTPGRQSSFNSERQSPRRGASSRRMSELNDMMDHIGSSPMVTGMKTLLQRSNTVHWSLSADDSSQSIGSPWLKAQVADIECRRWSSSAFVGKMLGIRVAREMITHFRAEFDTCFRHFVEGVPLRVDRHRDFLEELCAPLCTQFQVDQTYVLEAALAVLQPHAYLHIAEICFLLAVLGRSETLTKWIQYVALSMLKSCGTFASCEITHAIYRDWESLTIQLCYVLQLDSQGQIEIPHHVIAQVAVAVRAGCVFLSWCKQQWDVVRQAIARPFYSRVGEPKSGEDVNEFFADLSRFSFQQNLDLIRDLQTHEGYEDKGFAGYGNGFGYLFLRTVAAHLQGNETSIFDSSSQPDGEIEGSETGNHSQQPQLHRMYSLILMVSVLRTLYARGQVFLLGCNASGENGTSPATKSEELDMSSALFTPHKQWKALTENPLDGLRRWYSLIESHLRCEFDYSVKEVTCICGLYGLDGRSADLAAKVQDRINKFEDSLTLRGLNEAERHSDHNHHQHHHHFHFGFHHHARSSHRNDGENAAAEATTRQHYGLEELLCAIGIDQVLHHQLLQTSDDYILLLMRHPKYGVPMSVRRFRLDPRVHVKCFLLKDAFHWFISTVRIFASVRQARHFLSRCCKQRKIRLLVKHRGQDAHHFPAHHGRKRDEEIIDGDEAIEEDSTHSTAESEIQTDEEVIRVLAYQAMMFVDPWEVEAEGNTCRYMHNMRIPLHVELGWDRLSPICTAVVDDIAKAVFRGDAALCDMWQSTRGEGWLITSIIQYQLDGVHSHRSGHVETKCVFEEDSKVPFLVEVHSRSQRNALFQEVGLPHRFVGVVKVKLIAGKQLIPVKWIEYFNDPYVFFTLSTSEFVDLNSDTWSIQTYRSRCAPGGTNPVWNHAEEDEFCFRFAIPTHKPHFEATSEKCDDPTCKEAEIGMASTSRDEDGAGYATAECIWNSATTSAQDAAHHQSVEVLETLFQHSFTGPPLYLHCAVFHKTKLFAHHFMGRGKVALTPLTSGHPMDVWIPLEGVDSGSLHVEISLSFQLMCSSVTPHSANSYHRPMYDFISEQSTSLSESKHPTNGGSTEATAPSETRSADAPADADAPLLVDQVPPLPPHLMPHVPRSTGSRF